VFSFKYHRIVEAIAADREEPSRRQVEKEGIQMQTLPYRAPEVIFGDVNFGLPVDVWSVGIVFCELAGYAFTKKRKNCSFTQWGYAMCLMQQLGTPTSEDIIGLPLFPAQAPKFQKEAWPHIVHLSLGYGGCGFA